MTVESNETIICKWNDDIHKSSPFHQNADNLQIDESKYAYETCNRAQKQWNEIPISKIDIDLFPGAQSKIIWTTFIGERSQFPFSAYLTCSPGLYM